MRVILFTGDSPSKILDGTKTLTARCWRANPPAVGDVVRAQSGRKKETTFAYLHVLDVFEWSGSPYIASNRERTEFATKEGFDEWHEFYEAYRSLNAWCWDDPKRTHWFIEFEMVDEIKRELTGGE